jgi:hypothetical protein
VSGIVPRDLKSVFKKRVDADTGWVLVDTEFPILSHILELTPASPFTSIQYVRVVSVNNLASVPGGQKSSHRYEKAMLNSTNGSGINLPEGVGCGCDSFACS